MKNSNNNKNRVKDFLYEDITYKIRGCAFKESVYQKSLAREFNLFIILEAVIIN